MSGSHNKHAKISPSGLDRTTTCTASVAYIERLKDADIIPQYEPSNIYGEMGTFAHDLAEKAILHLIGKIVDPEISKAKSLHAWLESKNCHGQKGYGDLENYIDYCLSCRKHPKDRVYVEKQSQLFYSDDVGEKGTCDFIILHYDKSITVVDLKWRRSGMVESVENKQLATYAQSFIKNGMLAKAPANTKLHITTYNPLVHPYVDPWDTTVGELNKFCSKIEASVKIIEEGIHTTFNPNEKACVWCPARSVCRAKAEKLINAMPDTLGLSTFEADDMVQWFQMKKEISQFFDNIETHLTSLAEKGNPVKGTKLVEGASRRHYVDEDTVTDFLGNHLSIEEYTETSLLPFSKVMPKLTPDVKKAFEAECLVKPKGNMKLVVSTDDRQSLVAMKSKLFKGIK
jgi:hypothetical protein